MKTTIKLGLCAAALLLIFAGCSNVVKPTEVNDSMVKAAVTGDVSGANAFKVNSIDSGTAYGDDIAQYVVKVTFNKPVTKDSLHNGITFYKLSDATETYTMPKFESTYNTDVRVVENEVYFTLPHKAADLKDVYIFVDATKVEAANGAKLNQDKDTVWGEPGDDDYATYISPAGGSTLKGNKAFAKALDGGDNATLSASLLGLVPSYAKGTGAAVDLVKKIEITSGAALQALFDSSEWTEDGKIAAVTGIIKDHLKFEQYNWEKKEWEPLSPSFKRDSGKWVSDVTVTPDRKIRYKWVGTDKISLSSKLYGYDLRWSLKANAKRTVVQTPPPSGYETTGSVSLSENSLWPSDALYTVKTTQGRVEIIFDPWHAAITSPSVPAHYTSFNLWADNTWYSVTPANTETGKCSLFAGFATDTLIKDNFKCFEGTGANATELAIKDISWESSNVAVYPNANNKVVILFNDVTKTADDVYISPNVRTAVFSGSYAKGSERVSYPIKSLSFANTAPTTDPYALGGWVKK